MSAWWLIAAGVVAGVLVVAIVLRATLRMLFDAHVHESVAWNEIDERLARRDEIEHAHRVQMIERDPDDWGFERWAG